MSLLLHMIRCDGFLSAPRFLILRFRKDKPVPGKLAEIQVPGFSRRDKGRKNEPEKSGGVFLVGKPPVRDHELPFLFHGEDAHECGHKVHRTKERVEIGAYGSVFDPFPDRVPQEEPAEAGPERSRAGNRKTQLLFYQRPEYRIMAKRRMYVCSLEAALDVIGGKWKPHILWKIKDAPLRFMEIQEKLPAISQKMLTRQLRALEADCLVSRTEYPNRPPRVEYALTERGQTVIPVLKTLKDWADVELKDQINEIH